MPTGFSIGQQAVAAAVEATLADPTLDAQLAAQGLNAAQITNARSTLTMAQQALQTPLSTRALFALQNVIRGALKGIARVSPIGLLSLIFDPFPDPVAASDWDPSFDPEYGLFYGIVEPTWTTVPTMFAEAQLGVVSDESFAIGQKSIPTVPQIAAQFSVDLGLPAGFTAGWTDTFGLTSHPDDATGPADSSTGGVGSPGQTGGSGTGASGEQSP